MRARFENGEGVGCPVPSTPITPAFAASGALDADRLKEGGGSAPDLTPPCLCCRQERRFRETSCRNSVCTGTAESQARMQPSHASNEGKQTQQHAREISRQSFYVNITRVWHLHTTIPALAALRNTQKSAGTISAARWYHPTAALPHEGSSMHATSPTRNARDPRTASLSNTIVWIEASLHRGLAPASHLAHAPSRAPPTAANWGLPFSPVQERFAFTP